MKIKDLFVIKMLERNLREYSVNNPVGQRMVAISDKVLFINQEIMICIQLPELAIYYIEVFIREEPVPKDNHTLYFINKHLSYSDFS